MVMYKNRSKITMVHNFPARNFAPVKKWETPKPSFFLRFSEAKHRGIGLTRTTLWLFHIAMENDPFIDDVPIKKGPFSKAMFNNQRLNPPLQAGHSW